MDRKQLIGLILIFVLFYTWSMMNSKSRKQIEEKQRIEDSIAQANLPLVDTLPLSQSAEVATNNNTSNNFDSNDSLANAKLSYQYGPFYQAARGEESEYTLENDKLKITFSNKGGFVKKALVKDFNKVILLDDKSEKKEPLYLLEDEKNSFVYDIPIKGVPNNTVKSDELYYQVEQSGNSIIFRAPAGNNAFFQQKYTIGDDSYDLDYEISMHGLDGDIDSRAETMKLEWTNYLDKLERNVSFEKFYSTVYFKEKDKDSDYCNCRKDDTEDYAEDKIHWVSNNNQFFNTSLIANDKPFEGAILKTEMQDDDSEDLKKLQSEVNIPLPRGNAPYAMTLYLGPNDFNILSSYDVGLEEVVPFGRSIFGSINRWVIRPLFNFLNNITGNKGVAIILMIFLIKLLLYPLTYKMLKSQARMAALKPEIEKIKGKHKDDPQAANMENMKLYREYGVSPLGGCMPMILQMPIWYALFRFFPASIDFRQEPFLWATDLSSYDVIAYLPFEIPAFGAHISLFTVLWALSTVAYTYYSTRHVDMSAQPAMKYVQYFMPLMFLFFFNNYASGLTCYMFFSNLFNIGQTVGTRKFVFNEEKIRAELMEDKKKPKKVGKFQARMQEAMKQSQAIQEERRKAKKGK